MRERWAVTACDCCEDAYNCTSSMHTSAVACEGHGGCAHALAGAAGCQHAAREMAGQTAMGTRQPCGGPQGMRTRAEQAMATGRNGTYTRGGRADRCLQIGAARVALRQQPQRLRLGTDAVAREVLHALPKNEV